MGPIHPIYSVRDKCKVDAEVIDVRTTDGAKGLRYQLVGRHPEDGTTVTTFCSESVAEDFKKQLEILPHGLAAEGITILEDSAEQPAADHLPESTAEVMSADGTPIEDDIEEYIEDPVIGSASEGTITTVSEAEEVEVLAAEGPDPAAYDPLTESPVEESPLDEGPSPETFDSEAEEFGGFDVSLSNYTPVDSVTVEAPLGYGVTQNLGAEDGEQCPESNCDGSLKQVYAWMCDCCDFVEHQADYDAETFGVAGIDVQLPSQILVETPDSDQLVVPDPDLFPQGGGRVLGQQTGKVNATPMHAEGDEYDEYDDESRYERADVDRYEYERGKEAGEDEPTFFKNKRVLVPTAVIAGLGLAYLTKPDLFKGAFGSIADALDRMKGDKSTDEDES